MNHLKPLASIDNTPNPSHPKTCCAVPGKVKHVETLKTSVNEDWRGA